MLLTELAAFSFNLISTALPGIGAHFHTAQAGWTITVTNLAGGLLYPVTGRLGDLYGKRRILLLLTAGGVVGAVLSAVASDFPLFLLGRGLQALLLPTLPLAYSLIRDVFPPRIMATAASLTVTGFGATFVISPFLAGWLIDSFSYRGVFWFLAAYPAVCLVMILALVPETPVRARRRLDYTAAVMLGLSAPAIVLGLSEGSVWHWTSPATLGCVAAGVILAVLWYRRDASAEQPLVDVRLLRSRAMRTTLLASGLIYGTAAIAPSIAPALLMTSRSAGGGYGFGVDAFGVAWFTAPMGACMVLGGLLAGSRTARWGARAPMLVGCLLLAVGSVVLATLPDQRWQMTVALAFYGAGMGLSYAGQPNLIIQAVPQEELGISAAMGSIAQNLGTAVAVQAVFVVLAQHPLGSGAAYSGHGYTLAFLIGTGCAVVSAVAVALVPHGRRSVENTPVLRPADSERVA
ncbi:MFS transporter [Streptomyces spiralis]|uniref:MFS transporter n=1 Tax=Streptomyces spiralis TaxID=66376 RepID=UPI0033F03BF8